MRWRYKYYGLWLFGGVLLWRGISAQAQETCLTKDFVILEEAGRVTREREEERQRERQTSGREQQTAQEEYSSVVEEALEKCDFREIESILQELLPQERISFGKIVASLVQGRLPFSFSMLKRFVQEQLYDQFCEQRATMIRLLFFAMLGAVFANVSRVTQQKQVAKIGFLVLYLLFLTVLLTAFQESVASVEGSVAGLTDFMKVLAPVYFLAVTFATGSSTSLVFYQLVLWLIYLVELLIAHVLLPLLHINIMLRVIDHLSPEERFSHFAELLGQLIRWTLKALLACVVGINVIQGLLAPAVDALKRSLFTKGLEAIPGVGSVIGGMTQTMLSAAILIRNSIGIGGILLCILLCFPPLLHMAVLAFFYKLLAGLMEPVADSRMTGCTASMGEGYLLLLQIVFTVGTLFLLTIAVVATTTSG